MSIIFFTLMFLVFLIMPGFGHGQCSNTTIPQNHKILFDLLIKNTPLHGGFYNTSVSNNSDDQVYYGVSQCKPNVSSHVCANCLRQSLGSKHICPEFPELETMSSLCTAKISNKNVIGVWTNSSIATFGQQGLDEPLVFSRGFSMMQGLAKTVPREPLMYQAAEIDVGADGKRYGWGVCGRDLSKVDCESCLVDRLVSYRSYVMNRTGWEIVGSSCSMWYANVSEGYKDQEASAFAMNPWTLPSYGFPPRIASVAPRRDTTIAPGGSVSGVQRSHGKVEIVGIINISTLTILLLATQVLYSSLITHSGT